MYLGKIPSFLSPIKKKNGNGGRGWWKQWVLGAVGALSSEVGKAAVLHALA